MTGTDRVRPGPPDGLRRPLAWPRLGALPSLALPLALVLIAPGFDPDRWYAAGLGWLGTALLAGATLTAHRLRSSFEDEIAEQRTLATTLGDAGTRILYAGLVAAAYATLAGLTLVAPWTAIAMLTAVLLAMPARQLWSGAVGNLLVPVVRDTALVCVYYGALVGLGLMLSAT